MLYVLETSDSINTVEDLKGKTIYSTGKGTTPEYVLNYILESNGIDPATDVTIEYKSEATEVAAIARVCHRRRSGSAPAICDRSYEQ